MSMLGVIENAALPLSELSGGKLRASRGFARIAESAWVVSVKFQQKERVMKGRNEESGC
jgi:hypothetical protein